MFQFLLHWCTESILKNAANNYCCRVSGCRRACWIPFTSHFEPQSLLAMPCCRCKACGCFFVEIWWALCFWRHSWPSTLTCVLVQCPDSFPPGMPLSWICAMLCAIGSGYCTWYIGAISIVGRQPDLSHQSLVNGDQPIIKVVCIYIYIHMQCVWINDKCIVSGICIYCTDYIYIYACFFPSAEWLYPI